MSTLRTLKIAVLAGALSLALCGCERPVKVNANPSGTTKLQLRGDLGAKGKLLRGVVFESREYPKGTELSVMETWMLRAPGSKPPGYRITGLYDATKRAEGFVLPDGSIDVYYLCVTEVEGRKVRIAVPAEHFGPVL